MPHGGKSIGQKYSKQHREDEGSELPNLKARPKSWLFRARVLVHFASRVPIASVQRCQAECLCYTDCPFHDEKMRGNVLFTAQHDASVFSKPEHGISVFVYVTCAPETIDWKDPPCAHADAEEIIMRIIMRIQTNSLSFFLFSRSRSGKSM